MHSEEFGSLDENLEIKLESNTVTLLTELVRRQYKSYLRRQLEENVRVWQKFHQHNSKPFQTLIEKCTEKLEDLAIKEAILCQLYQRAMLKTITAVRRSTKECCLTEELKQLFECNSKLREPKVVEYVTATTQTDPIESELSLDQRIDIFQEQLKKNDNFVSNTITNPIVNEKSKANCFVKRKKPEVCNSQNIKRSKLNRWHSPTPPPKIPVQNGMLQFNANGKSKSNEDGIFQVDEDDEIAQQLEKLFTEQETDLDEIFGIVTNAHPHCGTNIESKNSESQETPNINLQSSCPSTQSPIETDTIEASSSSNKQLVPNQESNLRYSLWPCECFMQKRRLSTTLNRLMEEDIRWYDILKYQFSVLFGEDSDDEFAPCSPSIELNDILRSSCARRISPWIVRHLMKPLNDGLIGNRFLFKKLAKKLVNYIISENQYPDEYVIKTAIENFFCIHRAVMTADDLNDFDEINLSITSFK